MDPLTGLPAQHGDHLFDGGYDFIGTGSTPPVTAQAKGHDVDLRGKRVALGHGSWQTTLLLLALEQAGLSWQDITPVNAYDNAAQQFLSGEVDAWIGSYPYLTGVEAQAKVRGLVPTEDLFTHRSLWFTTRSFATSRTAELAAIVNALQESDRWIQDNWAEAAALFADQDTGGGASDVAAG